MTSSSAKANIENAFITATLRALVASHPDRARLRRCWDVEMAGMWTWFATTTSGEPTDDERQRFSELQARWQEWISLP